MIGASNAVNLTDGLDGLAIVPVAIAAACFGLIAYLVGRVIFPNIFKSLYVPGTAELAILCGALVGGAMGFYGLMHPRHDFYGRYRVVGHGWRIRNNINHGQTRTCFGYCWRLVRHGNNFGYYTGSFFKLRGKRVF